MEEKLNNMAIRIHWKIPLALTKGIFILTFKLYQLSKIGEYTYEVIPARNNLIYSIIN